MTTLALAALTLVLAPQERIKAEIREVPAGERPEFASEPGWELMFPQEFRLGRKWGFTREDGLIISGYSAVDADGGVLRFHCVQVGPGMLDVNAPEYRVVVFDADGKRYLPERDQAGGLSNRSTHAQTYVFSLAPRTIDPGRIAYVAVERSRSGPRPDQKKS